jgi:hypothetical protein
MKEKVITCGCAAAFTFHQPGETTAYEKAATFMKNLFTK